MAQSVFKRVEKKFMLSREQYEMLRKEIAPYITEDKYSNYTIRNLYFDTDNYELIRKSLEKPVYKEKVRLRCYNQPDSDTQVFLEIKKKYEGVVNKRRITLSLEDAEKFLAGKDVSNINPQISEELRFCLQKYDLKPKLYLAYDRLAFSGIDDKELRITFDYNIRSRENNLTLRSDDDTLKLLNSDYILMEVKFQNAMPYWFVSILSKLKIRNISFSKYGSIYKEKVLAKRTSNPVSVRTYENKEPNPAYLNRDFGRKLILQMEA